MPSYMTLAVIALTASTASPALSAPVQEVRGQTRSLGHPSRALASLEDLAKLAKKLLPHHGPKPGAIGSGAPPVVPEHAAPPAVHPSQESGPVPNQPHELDSTPPQAPDPAAGKSKWKTAGNAMLDFGLATAGTVAGMQILGGQSASSANSTNSTNSVGADNSTDPTDTTNSTDPTNPTNPNTNTKLQGRALVRLEEALSRFRRMLDELD